MNIEKKLSPGITINDANKPCLEVHSVKMNYGFWRRLYYLISNPFLYVFKGKWRI